MLKKLRGGLELMRPANILTAFADILAGFAAAGGAVMITGGELAVSPEGLFWLLAATFGLYGGGIVFNDVFDARLDAMERPERAIPSGRISVTEASGLGFLLLAGGIFSAFQVNAVAGALAGAIALSALIYDAIAKKSAFFGPLFMGLCRGGNLLLGCSIIPAALSQLWFLALIPVIYIAAITLVSRGEVSGGKTTPGYAALLMILAVTASFFALSAMPSFNLLPALPFVFLFGILVIPPFCLAARKPMPANIKKAVKRGVLCLVVLNSAFAAGFSGLILGGIVFILLPVSIAVAKLFAVT